MSPGEPHLTVSSPANGCPAGAGGEGQGHAGPAALLGGYAHGQAHLAGKLAHQVEAHAGGTGVAAAVGAGEAAVKHAPQVLGRDAHAVVLHEEQRLPGVHARLPALGPQAQVPRLRALAAVLGGVAHELSQHELHPLGVRAHREAKLAKLGRHARVDERPRVSPQRRAHHVCQHDLAHLEVAVKGGGAGVVERLLHVALNALQLCVHGVGHRPGVVGGRQAPGGYGGLHLVDPGLHVVAVVALLGAHGGHLIGHGLGGLAQRVQEGGLLQRRRLLGELGRQVAHAVLAKPLHRAVKPPVEAPPPPEVQQQRRSLSRQEGHGHERQHAGLHAIGGKRQHDQSQRRRTHEGRGQPVPQVGRKRHGLLASPTPRCSPGRAWCRRSPPRRCGRESAAGGSR